MGFRKSVCNHKKEWGQCLRTMKKIYQMLYWGMRAKFKGNRKAEFPSKAQFAFTATTAVTKDVMTMFVGLAVFRAAFIQQGHAIFNLQPIFLSAPSFIGFKTQQGRACFPEQIPFFPTFSLITTAQIKLLMESTQVTAGHCQHIV